MTFHSWLLIIAGLACQIPGLRGLATCLNCSILIVLMDFGAGWLLIRVLYLCRWLNCDLNSSMHAFFA